MKFALGFALLVFAVVAHADETPKLNDEMKAALLKNVAECSDQEKLSKEAVMELRDGNFANADEKQKCFTHCFMEKTGFTVNGEIKKNVVVEKLGAIYGADKVKAVQEACDSTTGANKCDTAFKLYECYYKHKSVTI